MSVSFRWRTFLISTAFTGWMISTLSSLIWKKSITESAAHADELKRYNSAYRLLKKLCGRTDVDLKALSAEHHALEKKVIVKTDELETIRGDLKELRTIRYYVSRVLPEEPAPENVPVQVQLSEGRLRSGIDQEKKQRTPKKQMEKHIEESQTKRR